MTFEEAMSKSEQLRMEAFEGVAFRLPDREERIRPYIAFNPYFYAMEEFYAKQEGDGDDRRGTSPEA